MIYTVTLNPSIDYYMEIPSVKMGTVNRSSEEHISCGGKGINVSRMLNMLNMENTAIAVIGGNTGSAFMEELKREKISIVPVNIRDNTRINIKLSDGTELNGAGPVADETTIKELKSLLNNLKKEDFVIFSGSICRGISIEDYGKLIEDCVKDNIRVAVDGTGKILNGVIQRGLYLIKPNIDELSELFDRTITSGEDVAKYALKLVDMGVENVLVSLGSKGAILASKDGVCCCNAPEVKVYNCVCAGDCMLAGFISAINEGADSISALEWAVACGSARVSCKNSFPSKGMVRGLYNDIQKI